MEIGRSSETSVTIYQTTQRHISKELLLIVDYIKGNDYGCGSGDDDNK
jgi:hypothetical protein